MKSKQFDNQLKKLLNTKKPNKMKSNTKAAPSTPVKDARKPLFENAMAESVGMRATCNECDRIIWEDENWLENYIDNGGYCKDCRPEAEPQPPAEAEMGGFTPGEWESRGNKIFVKGTNNSICQVHVKNNYKPITFEPIEDVEARANQALLLAAPTLYRENERLKELLQRKYDLIAENKELKEQVRVLREALQSVYSVTNHQNFTDRHGINETMAEAINQTK